MEEKCIFCRIVAGQVPCYKVFEDEHNLAFLDIQPVARGHVLVIPKQHAERLTQVTELESYARAVGAVCLKVEHGLSKHYNIFGAQGAKAWQTIFHHHLHVIPRYGGEKVWDWPAGKLGEDEARALLQKLAD